MDAGRLGKLRGAEFGDIICKVKTEDCDASSFVVMSEPAEGSAEGDIASNVVIGNGKEGRKVIGVITKA